MKLRNSNVYDFLKSLNGRKIACFGHNYGLYGMANMYPEVIENDLIECIVDNDEFQWGNSCILNGQKYYINSPDELKKMADKVVIVIFVTTYYQIIEQLDLMKELTETECYIFSLMHCSTPFAEEKLPTKYDEIKIPKIIHYCWFGGGQMSELAKKCVASWKEKCPDFEIQKWDENNYNVDVIPYVRQAYNNKAYAFVSDYARLDILYRYGGVYVDTDVEFLKNISPLLRNDAYSGFSLHAPRIATGLGMGARRGLPIIQEMMDIYKYERYITDYGINNTLCQEYNTKVLVHNGLIQNGRYQVVADMTCYPKDYLDPKSSHFGILTDTTNAFSIHHSANTWSSNTRFGRQKEASRKMLEKTLKRIELEI